MTIRRIRASAVCQTEGHLLLVKLRDPSTGVTSWFPPGGAIEPGETPAQAAERETLEETGVAIRVDPALAIVERYPFRWDDEDYDVTTHALAAELVGDAPQGLEGGLALPRVDDVAYNLGAAWMPLARALEELAARPPILAATQRVLRLAEVARWKRHPNIAGPASTLLMIHAQFRAASERLLLLLSKEPEPRRLGRVFQPLAQTLHHHHHAEEAMLFPMIERMTGVAPLELENDHRTLTDAIDDVSRHLADESSAADAQRVAAHFNTVLIEHLDREESLVVPVLLQLSPREAWAVLEGRAP